MKKLCYEHKSLHIFLTVKNILFAPFCKRDTKKKDVGHQKSASSECDTCEFSCHRYENTNRHQHCDYVPSLLIKNISHNKKSIYSE